MSWRCDLTGKKPLVGHKVSHSNIKTKRRFLPNLRNVTLISDTLGRRIRLRVSANALKTVDHRGGLDAFLLKAKDDELAPRVLELKRQIVKKRKPRRARQSASCHAGLVRPFDLGHSALDLHHRAPADARQRLTPPRSQTAAADCAGSRKNCRPIPA